MTNTMLSLFLLLGLAAASSSATVARAKVSPVQKVIQLIDGMAGKVTKEDEQLLAGFEEFAKFCDDEATSKSYAIKDSKEEIEGLTATVVDSKAIIESEGSKVNDLSTKISNTDGEIASAGSLRAQEKANFLKTEKELVGTVEELSGAQKEIKKSMAFIQAQGGRVSAGDMQAMNAVIQGLGQIVEASFVTKSQKDRIASLLQARADAEEDAELGSQAHTMNVDAIMETLGEMEDKADGSLQDARKGEGEAASNHALLKQGLENEIANAKKAMGEATSAKAGASEAQGNAEEDLGAANKGLNQDTAYLKDLKRDCQTRASEFEVETKDNKAELTALSKAKAILLKKFAALLQTTAQVAVASHDDANEDAKARALRAIEQLGKQLHKTALVALAYRAASDPFGKIRGMVEDMIAKLLQEAAEEATQKAFCDQEIGESTTSKEDKEGKLGKVNARLEKGGSSVASLTEGVSKLSAEVAENDAAMAKATAMRQNEKAAFLVVEKDLSESQEACAAATEVLREYYEGASLLQTGSKAQAKDAEQGDGSGILGVLEVAESDFAKGLAEARTGESTAQGEYDKMAQDSKLLKTTKEMEIKGKQSEVKSIKTSLSDLSSDKEGLTGELDAVLSYLDKLKPQCETKVPSYAERKAAREQEIDGLKGALEILQAPALIQTGRHLRRARA